MLSFIFISVYIIMQNKLKKESKFMSKKVAVLIMSILLLSPLLGDNTGINCSASGANIALGKSYTIESGAANDYSYGQIEIGSKNQLTDGVFGNAADHYGGPWSHFVREISRTITLDLEQVMAVEGFEVAFIQRKTAGIYCPKQVVFSISENGEDYMTVASVRNPVDNTVETPTRATYNFISKKIYKARYVKIYFDVAVNSFLDEIQVFGSDNTKGASSITPDEKKDTSFYYDSGKDIGAKDIVCFHYGYWPDDESLANNKKDVFKPYIGYIDEKGNYLDTMFDAVMFLIIQGRCPSGGNLNSNGEPAIMSDWEYLIENTFGKDINLDALDEATAELKDALGLPKEHRTTVYLSAPHPKVSDLEFGDYDGDGKVNKIESLEDCIAVYSWFIDEVLKRYDEKGYKNIELKGFFWSNESLSSEHFEQEPEYAAGCVRVLHERNMQCIFIPFYQAAGIELAQEIGFDATIMQANLSFNEPLQRFPEKMMEDFAYTAGKFHTGIQMEAHHSFRYDIDKYAPLYKQYLVSAAKSGLMTDAIHAYYQGAGYGVFYQWAVSDNPRLRWFYDATYKFIKCSLDFPEFKINATTEGTVEKNEFFTGIFEIEGDWSPFEYNLSISKQPKNGILFIDMPKGQYKYRSDRTFIGEDSFILKYTDQSGETVEIPVNITVTGNGNESVISSDNSESLPDENESRPVGSKSNTPKKGWIYAIIGGVAATALAAFILIKKKKK